MMQTPLLLSSFVKRAEQFFPDKLIFHGQEKTPFTEFHIVSSQNERESLQMH